METGVPPTHRYPTRWKLDRYPNSQSSLSQEPRVDDKAENNVFVTCKGKRREKQRNERIIYLPREVIFDILLLLPANFLHEVVRYVCKQWYDIVNDPFFIRAHCQIPTTSTSSASFIIQHLSKRHEVYCAQEDGVITKIQLPFPVKIQGSCNGLVLFCDNEGDEDKLYIMNPLRKVIVSLPRVIPVLLHKAYHISYSFAINSSGQYKVVQLSLYTYPRKLEMSVFTIGVDKAWRHIGVPIDMNVDTKTQTLRTGGVLIAGFLFWGSRNCASLAMDVDTETFYLISWPNDDLISREFCDNESRFINMGTALGLMVVVENQKRSIWKLLRLTDVKSSEWTEIGTINIGAMIKKVSKGKWTYDSKVSNMYTLKPISLIGNELCFCTGVDSESSWIICYNRANKSFMSFNVEVPWYYLSCIHHVPTLSSPRKMLRFTSTKLE